MSRMLPDGVFIGLDFEEYLEQDAMGSSKKGTLWLRGEGYYWKYLSPFRPKRKSSPEQLFGTALHAALLEGMSAYENRYCVKPSEADYPDALKTEKDIRAALKREKVHLGSTTGWLKEDWAAAAEIHLPDAVVWDNLMDEFDRRHRGRIGISAEDDFAIRAMRDLATEDRPENQEMRELLSVGSEFPILSEISVIYTDEHGQRHCARFDKLLPVCTGDLKSVGEWQGRPLREVLDQHIKRNAYDVQLADYQVARQHMNRMILESEANIHGGTEEEREHLQAMAKWNQANRWDWVWLFFQKPTTAGNAPVLFPLRDPWRGPYHTSGYRKRHIALETYRRCMERFGPDKPWGRVEPIHWVDVGKEHHIMISPYDWAENDLAPDEEQHFTASL